MVTYYELADERKCRKIRKLNDLAAQHLAGVE
jgi:hypothetical protein